MKTVALIPIIFLTLTIAFGQTGQLNQFDSNNKKDGKYMLAPCFHFSVLMFLPA
jgi:hypothetical protein